jgi:hypothetical protein
MSNYSYKYILILGLFGLPFHKPARVRSAFREHPDGAKSVEVVELSREHLEVRQVPLAVERQVRVIEGLSFEEVLALATSVEQKRRENYLLVRITDDGPIDHAIERLREVYPHAILEQPQARLSSEPIVLRGDAQTIRTEEETKVVLVFEPGGLSYRVTLRPTQDRPKKRGEGPTTAQADAQLEDITAPSFRTLAIKVRSLLTKSARSPERSRAMIRTPGCSFNQAARVFPLRSGKRSTTRCLSKSTMMVPKVVPLRNEKSSTPMMRGLIGLPT